MPFYTHKQINFVHNRVMVYNMSMFYISLAHEDVGHITFALLPRRHNQLSKWADNIYEFYTTIFITFKYLSSVVT